MIGTLLSSCVYPNPAIEIDVDIVDAALNMDDHLIGYGFAGPMCKADQVSCSAYPGRNREVHVIVSEPPELPSFGAVEAHDRSFVARIRVSLENSSMGENEIVQEATGRWKSSYRNGDVQGTLMIWYMYLPSIQTDPRTQPIPLRNAPNISCDLNCKLRLNASTFSGFKTRQGNTYQTHAEVLTGIRTIRY